MALVIRPATLQAFTKLAEERGLDDDTLLRMMVKSFTKGPIIYGLNDILGFGKYNGEYTENVIRGDPRYMKWLVENSEWFKLDEEAFELLTDFVGDITFKQQVQEHG